MKKLIVLMVALAIAVGYLYGYSNVKTEVETETVVIHKDSTAEINLRSKGVERCLAEEYFGKKEWLEIQTRITRDGHANFYEVDENGEIEWLMSAMTFSGLDWAIQDAQSRNNRLVLMT